MGPHMPCFAAETVLGERVSSEAKLVQTVPKSHVLGYGLASIGPVPTLRLLWVFVDKIRQSGIETRLTSNLTPAMEMAHNRRRLGHPLDSQRQLWFRIRITLGKVPAALDRTLATTDRLEHLDFPFTLIATLQPVHPPLLERSRSPRLHEPTALRPSFLSPQPRLPFCERAL